ncbi:MAG: DUF4197 domain-containing protein [Verrucomicrobia bacterium]|nr:DUF4197 domain-containing protein [Verrucomicrobiota bacterium]
MKINMAVLLTAVALLGLRETGCAASFLDFLGLGRKGTNAAGAGATSVAGLSEKQITEGLKEALAKGVSQAVTNLGRAGGFLNNPAVRIPMPENLQRVERTLRTLGQERLADDFVATLNRAAEQAVPQAASVLGDSVKRLTVADARAILAGTNTAATAYFRRTSETNLHSRFLPIVREATSQTGVTSAYKQMLGKLGFASAFLGQDAGDLDGYVTRKTLDGLFLKIAEEEAAIRAHPAARTTDLLRQVFGRK